MTCITPKLRKFVTVRGDRFYGCIEFVLYRAGSYHTVDRVKITSPLLDRAGRYVHVGDWTGMTSLSLRVRFSYVMCRVGIHVARVANSVGSCLARVV
jgi:hypothetical protein